MLTGTISFTREWSVDKAREMLESLGVKVGRWCPTDVEFIGCEVDDAAYEKLDDYWGTFVWCLTPRKS